MIIEKTMPKDVFQKINYSDLRYEYNQRLLKNGNFNKQVIENTEDGRLGYVEAEYNRLQEKLGPIQSHEIEYT